MELDLKSDGDGSLFTVKAVPGSSRTSLGGVLDGMLKVRLAAPPEKGRANACLTDFLAGLFGVKKNAVSLVSGRSSAVKQIKVKGISPEAIRQILESNRE